MRVIILALSAVLFFGGTAIAQSSVVKTGNVISVSERLPGHEADTYRFGIAYNSMRGTTPGQCEAACNRDDSCASWSLVPATFNMGPRCELKRNIGRQEYRPGAVSGIAVKYHPRGQELQKAYTRPVPAPRPTFKPAPQPKPIAPRPRPKPKPAVAPRPAMKPTPRFRPQTVVTPTPNPAPRPQAPAPVQQAVPIPRSNAVPQRLTRPTVRPPQPIKPQPLPKQGLQGGPVKVYTGPSSVTRPAVVPRPTPAPLPVTRQPQPAPRSVTPKPAVQPQRPKQFEMQPTAVTAPQSAPRPIPTPQPAPVATAPSTTSGGVATEPPAPISQRQRVPWNQRTGNEPNYSVGDTDYVPGDEQATAGFLGGTPEEE